MIYGPFWALRRHSEPEPVKVGRPHRDRAKVKAARKASRRNR